MQGLVLRWCCMFFDNQWLLKVVANVSARSSSLPQGITDRCKIPYTYVSASLLRLHVTGIPSFAHSQSQHTGSCVPSSWLNHSWGGTAWMWIASLVTTCNNRWLLRTPPLLHKWSWIFIHYSITDMFMAWNKRSDHARDIPKCPASLWYQATEIPRRSLFSYSLLVQRIYVEYHWKVNLQVVLVFRNLAQIGM